jgi:hypothetical protein
MEQAVDGSHNVAHEDDDNDNDNDDDPSNGKIFFKKCSWHEICVFCFRYNYYVELVSLHEEFSEMS